MILFMCSSCGQNQKNNEKAPSGRSPMKDYFLNQGALFLNNHDFMKALMLADSAAKYADNKDDIYFFKGDIYYELGRLNRAIQAYIYTLEINPINTIPTNNHTTTHVNNPIRIHIFSCKGY